MLCIKEEIWEIASKLKISHLINCSSFWYITKSECETRLNAHNCAVCDVVETVKMFLFILNILLI